VGDVLREQLLDAIRVLFEGHGLETEATENSRYFAVGGVAVGVEAFDVSQTTTGWSCQMDVRVVLRDGQVLVESFSGIGADPGEMFEDALKYFTASSFHVILKALIIDGGPDEQVDVETWLIDGIPYRAFIGGVTSRGTPPDGAPPTSWVPAFESAIRAAAFDAETYWIRLYYAQMEHKSMAVEILVNNESSLPLQQRIEAYPWPHVAQFYSARLFLILRRAA